MSVRNAVMALRGCVKAQVCRLGTKTLIHPRAVVAELKLCDTQNRSFSATSLNCDGSELRWISPYWEGLQPAGRSRSCRRLFWRLPAFVRGSARLRRFDDSMRRADERGCAAFDRRSLGLAKLGRRATHRAASGGGRR